MFFFCKIDTAKRSSRKQASSYRLRPRVKTIEDEPLAEIPHVEAPNFPPKKQSDSDFESKDIEDQTDSDDQPYVEEKEKEESDVEGSFEEEEPVHQKHERKKRKIEAAAAVTPDIMGQTSKGTYRSNMQVLIKIMEDVKLRDEHIALLKKTPFWLLFDALINKKLKSDHSLKYDDIVVKIIQSYEKDGKTFNIGGKKVSFTKNDVRLILGISGGEQPLKITYKQKKDVSFVKRRNITDRRLTAKVIRKMIEKYVKSNKQKNVKDTVRLLCLYLCLGLLFSGSGTSIGWDYLQCMEDIEMLRKFDWCEAVRSKLMTSIEHYHEQPSKVTSCVMVLLVNTSTFSIFSLGCENYQ